MKERQNIYSTDVKVRVEGTPNSGFTLIEILIVLLIVTTVMALAIPRIRTVTREQSLREAARIVGSMIGKARDEAMMHGSAGVVLKRNPNFEIDGAWFASTEIGVLRAVPEYVGDQIYIKGAMPSRGATRVSSTKIDIPRPIEFEDNSPVSVGDTISINHSSSSFEITELEPNASTDGAAVLRLTVDVTQTYPSLPPSFDDVPFVIHRRPRLHRSSTQELGSQRIIDLRFSGFDPVFDSPVKDGDYEFSNYDIEILFSKSGHTGKLLYWELSNSNRRTGRLVTRTTSNPIYLLVTDTPKNPAKPPFTKLSFWVTVKFQPSNPTVGYTEILRPNAMLGSIGSIAGRARGIANEEAHH